MEQICVLEAPAECTEQRAWALEVTLGDRVDMLDRVHLHDPRSILYMTPDRVLRTELTPSRRLFGRIVSSAQTGNSQRLVWHDRGQWHLAVPRAWAVFRQPAHAGAPGVVRAGHHDLRLSLRWVPRDPHETRAFRPATLDLAFLRDLALCAMLLMSLAPLATEAPQSTHLHQATAASVHRMNLLLRTLEEQRPSSQYVDRLPSTEHDDAPSPNSPMLLTRPGPADPGDATVVPADPSTILPMGPAHPRSPFAEARASHTGGGGAGTEAYPSGDAPAPPAWGGGQLEVACASPGDPCAPSRGTSTTQAQTLAPPPRLLAFLDARAEIDRVLQENLEALEACAQHMDLPPSTTSGHMVFRLVIGLSGAPLQAEVHTSTLDNPGFEACLAQAIRVLSFPRPARGLLVDYPGVDGHFEPSPRAAARSTENRAHTNTFTAHLELTRAVEPSRLAHVIGD